MPHVQAAGGGSRVGHDIPRAPGVHLRGSPLAAVVSACASSLPAPQARSGISTKSDSNAKGF